MFQLRTDEHQDIVDFIDAATESKQMREWLARLEEVPEKVRFTHLQQVRNDMHENDEPETFLQIVDMLGDDTVLVAMNRVINDVVASGVKTRACLDKGGDVLKKFTALVILLES